MWSGNAFASPASSRASASARSSTRSPAAAYAIGVVHGVGGSAGVALLLLAGIADRAEAVVALLLFACATALSMALLSSGLGVALGLERVERRLGLALPLLGAGSLAFGLLYATAAVAAL